MVTCEDAQEKEGNFTYGYLLVSFAMWKWKPPIGRQLAPVQKGRLAKIFES
jgi:hypothetical protein